MRRSITFESGQIVLVPFPFVEQPRERPRPAVVISAKPLGPDDSLLWVLMITTAVNKGWPGDISLESRFAEAGLHVPCVVRAEKVSTVEAGRARVLGKLPADLMAQVRRAVRARLAL